MLYALGKAVAQVKPRPGNLPVLVKMLPGTPKGGKGKVGEETGISFPEESEQSENNSHLK